MSANKPSDRRKQDEGGTDLNLTPIMNLMVVLIPMLIQVAVFTKLALLQYLPPAEAEQSSSSGGGPEPTDTEDQPKNLDL